MLSKYFAYNLADQLNKITAHGFCVMDDFLPVETITALANEMMALNDAGGLLVAGTGQANVRVNKEIRGDYIHWLNEADGSAAQQVYFEKMEALRFALNQHLYLGLFALESHLAFYPIGAGYKKHLDRFKTKSIKTSDQAVRQVSCILYLNQNWLESNGGHLRVYLNTENTMQSDNTANSAHLDIAPIAGRLVMFLSDTFYHEVLPATRNRVSLTGWFLTR